MEAYERAERERRLLHGLALGDARSGMYLVVAADTQGTVAGRVLHVR